MQDGINDQMLDLKQPMDRTPFYELSVNTLRSVDITSAREQIKHGLKVNIAYALEGPAETHKCVFFMQDGNIQADMMDGLSTILRLEWANFFFHVNKKAGAKPVLRRATGLLSYLMMMMVM